MIVKTTINKKKIEFQAEPKESLLDVLRRLGYFGVKRGCSDGNCGACAILLDEIPRKSCIMFVGQIQNRRVTTIEGLGTPDDPHPIQEMFVEEAGVQCGYCIPGMIISAEGLLKTNASPTEEEIKQGLEGNLCRCTGYVKQIKAVKLAADIMRGEK